MARRQQEGEASEGETKSVAAGGVSVNYGPLNRRLGYVLRRAQIAVFRDFFAEFEAFGIRPGQYSILTVIENNPGLKQSVISEALGIRRANFVALIDELEQRGLLRRDPAPKDRRSNALVLTEMGARLMIDLHAAAGRHEERLGEALGRDGLQSLFAGLRKLMRMAGA